MDLKERTRSGRTVKRSSKFLEMEHEYEDEPMNRSEDEDGDFNFDEANNSDDESFEDDMLNFSEENMNRNSGRIRRTYPKGESQELVWKDGKLVTAGTSAPPIIHQVMEKPRIKTKSLSIEDNPPLLQVVKDDPGSKFYSHVFDVLNKPDLMFPKLNVNDSDNVNRSLPVLDLINDEKFKLKMESKNPSLTTKLNKSTDKMKDVIGLGVNMEELERYSRVTGYILYNLVSKKKSENQVQDSQSYRKIQEAWATMPDRNKRDWEIKAKQIKKQIDNKRRNEIIEDSSKKEKRRLALKKAEENIKKARLEDHNMVDLASYLKTVGEGMSKLAAHVSSYQGPVAVSSVEETLLDYLMSTMVPLIGIFEGSEGLDRQTTTDSLNKLTFLIPGYN